MPNAAAPVAGVATKYPSVSSVEATDGHRLILGFGSGEQRVFDVTPLDLDPEYLYERSQPA